MSVKKELSDLIKLAKGGKKEVIKAIMDDDELTDEFIKRIKEREAEKQLQENIIRSTGY